MNQCYGVVAALVLWWTMRSSAAPAPSPGPHPLGPNDSRPVRIQSLHTDRFIRVASPGGNPRPSTAYTGDGTTHFDLELLRLSDATSVVSSEKLYAVKTRNGDAYLKITSGGADSVPDNGQVLDKNKDASLIFRGVETTCEHTFAFESLSDTGKYLSDNMNGELRLLALDVEAAKSSACLERQNTQRQLPHNILFRIHCLNECP